MDIAKPVSGNRRKQVAVIVSLGVLLLGAVVVFRPSTADHDPAQSLAPVETKAPTKPIVEPPQELSAATEVAEPERKAPKPKEAIPPPQSAAAQQKSAWLTSKLVGGDNIGAARKTTEITESPNGYEIYIQNQFGIRCALTFNDEGNPASLTSCKAESSEWDPTGPIELRCVETKSGTVCSGKWTSRNQTVNPSEWGTLAFQILGS